MALETEPGNRGLARVLRKAGRWLGLAALLILGVALRCWNVADVWIGGKLYFVDPDGYSRMTRVAAVLREPGSVLRQHFFENWPLGIIPHTTAPLDYLIAGLAVILRPSDPAAAADWAGALISIGFGVATMIFLWSWAGPRRYRAAMLALFAVSPILVHGTLFGRPDHQSALIFLLAVALGAEAVLLRETSRRWSVTAGAAWGAALWVSLYEPLLLFAAVLLLGVALRGRRYFARERWAGWGTLLVILLIALAIERWRPLLPDAEVIRYFPDWSRNIGELQPASFSTLLRWSLAWLPLAPLALWAAARRREGGDPSGWFWLGLLLVTAGLTFWQARWGYFFSLVFVMSLPMQAATLERWLGGRRWAVAVLGLLALWPVARDWDDRFNEGELARRAQARQEHAALRDVALRIKKLAADRRDGEPVPILAPWWHSPALAYWSGQPCVAGSSHQSLPGTVASARFFLQNDPEAALKLLGEREVGVVVVDDPVRVLQNSAQLLGEPPPAHPEAPLGYRLYTRPNQPPPGLEPVYRNRAFVLMRRTAW
ncbi:MAG TPA: hypothetical protein VNQ90_07510 [Chthoniobacteraceae bacterium]|nr:hypothetical protein [Chthoniobacteraceae bacterium]